MSDFLHLIRYLYDSLRWRLLIWLSLIVASSLLEGFTLGLFLPIIAGTDSDSPLHAFLTSLFDTLGLRYTLPLALGAVTALYVGRDRPGRLPGNLRGPGPSPTSWSR